MSFEGSYLAGLRKKIGHDLVLMPGACVLVEDEKGRILLTLRTDNDLWCIPGGAAEPGDDFVSAALTELLEEAGLEAERQDLVPFATNSNPAVERIHYDNGDITQYFVLCFATKRWRKKTDVIDTTEVKDLAFYAPDQLPANLTPSTHDVLKLYDRYQKTGKFQAG